MKTSNRKSYSRQELENIEVAIRAVLKNPERVLTPLNMPVYTLKVLEDKLKEVEELKLKWGVRVSSRMEQTEAKNERDVLVKRIVIQYKNALSYSKELKQNVLSSFNELLTIEKTSKKYGVHRVVMRAREFYNVLNTNPTLFESIKKMGYSQGQLDEFKKALDMYDSLSVVYNSSRTISKDKTFDKDVLAESLYSWHRRFRSYVKLAIEDKNILVEMRYIGFYVGKRKKKADKPSVEGESTAKPTDATSAEKPAA